MFFDTIMALSTAPLTAAIGIIRISGPKAFEITDKILNKSIKDSPSNTLRRRDIIDGNGETADEAVVAVFRAPNSYTGEDTVEIYCHGGLFILNRVQLLLLKNGARQALNGEFTKRAFMNGKMDLTQVEAVSDLIAADSKFEAASALNQLKGNLSVTINKICSDITDIAAQILAFIDYPDDEISDVSPETLSKKVFDAYKRLAELEKSYDNGKIIKDGIITVIAGKPNVGKSSLMNYLSGSEKSIVTDIAGTTRDVVEDTVVFGGHKLLLSDTAGIRNTDDTIEKIGVLRAEKKLDEAALILCVFDNSAGLDKEDYQLFEKIKTLTAKKIAVLNKSDKDKLLNKKEFDIFDAVVEISALRGNGFDILEKEVSKLFLTEINQNTDIITNLRHFQCISCAKNALENAGLNIKMTPDAVLIDIEEAIAALSEMTGKSVSEQILENIFSRFCVGK